MSISNSQRVAARISGVSGLLAVAIVIVANYALLDPLIVPRDASETARNFMAHQTQVRVALTCFLSYSASVIVLLTALYTVLKPIDPMLALVAALLRLVHALLWSFSTLNLLGALRTLGGTSYLQSFEPSQLQAFARLNISAIFDDYYIGLPFFGLAATVCSYLWLRSGYIPRMLAIFGIVSSAWCVICAFGFLMFPDLDKAVNAYWFDSPMALFEVIVSFWLLVMGLPRGVIHTSPGEHERP